MTLCISTSGPFAVVALFGTAGDCVFRESRVSNRAASAAIFGIFEQLDLSNLSRIVVDVGPGSFTGVRVGVTIAKLLAHLKNLPLFAINAFDLLGPGPVAIPSKRGEVYFRVGGEMPVTKSVEFATEVPDVLMVGDPELQSIFSFLPENCLVESDPLVLVPLYVANPSISQAKQSHIMGETFGGRKNV